MATKKPIWKSKTFYVSLGLLFLTILNEITSTIKINSELLALIFTLAMIILRVFTTQAVDWKWW